MRPLPLLPRRLPLAPTPDARFRPIYAVWEVTLRCDLACRHCGSRASHPREGELTTAEALDLIQQMADLGVTEVTLIGGEAYLRDDWLELIRAVTSTGMHCTMTTGGRHLTPDRARAARDAGLRSASVSVDGLRDTHDALRAPGSFDAALAAIAALRDAGLPAAANTQIGRASAREIDAIARLLLAAGIYAWQVQLTAAMGRAADHPELLLDPWQLLEVLPAIERAHALCKSAGVRLYPGNNLGYFGPCETALRGDLPKGHFASCGAGRATLGIEANGDIKGCPSLPTADYVGGNVREHRLAEIWQRAPALAFTRDRTIEDLWGFCRSCYYAEACLAGCTWTAHVLFGRRGNNPFCHHRALELLRMGKRERLVPVERAPGAPFDFGRFDLVVEEWPADDLARARAAHLGAGASTIVETARPSGERKPA
jgi:radical SAM protein with 4Fe4S-binding SPASM domain